jgi:AcrR family transcriptional regulator
MEPVRAAAPAPVPAGVRTTGRRGERTRARLLEAARTTFASVGWPRVRVEDVCRAAGVGHGTFYAYYGNRVEILEALVRRHAAALYALVEASWVTQQSRDPGLPRGREELRDDVRRVLAGFLELSARDADIRRVWLAAAPSEPALAALVEEVRGQFVARIEANLRGAVADGAGRGELDIEIAAPALAAMVEQTVARSLAPPPPDGDRLVEGLTDLWVHAVYLAGHPNGPGLSPG